jgi:hypothetical protein
VNIILVVCFQDSHTEQTKKGVYGNHSSQTPHHLFNEQAGLLLSVFLLRHAERHISTFLFSMAPLRSFSERRSSGLDFSDRDSTLDHHPDLQNNAALHLRRNETERRRLQGLQMPSKAVAPAPYVPQTFQQKFNVWMINEGGKRVFFFVWIFLHLLVAVFGFINFQLKDNLVIARKTFGITFRQFYFTFERSTLSQNLCSYRPHSCSRSPCGHHLHPPACMPEFHLAPPPDASEQHHTVRQEHHLPQSHSMVHCRLDRRPYRCAHGELL